MDNVKTEVFDSLKISEDVIAKVAEVVTGEVDGVAQLLPVSNTMKRIIVKSGNDFIKVQQSGDVVAITMRIVVKDGSNVIKVAEKVQSAVKMTVQNMTGIAVSKVNVIIAKIEF